MTIRANDDFELSTEISCSVELSLEMFRSIQHVNPLKPIRQFTAACHRLNMEIFEAEQITKLTLPESSIEFKLRRMTWGEIIYTI